MRPLVSDSSSGAELRDRIPFVKEMGLELLLGDNGRSKLALEVLCVHRSSTLAFCEAEVRDEADRLVARASGTFKFLRELST